MKLPCIGLCLVAITLLAVRAECATRTVRSRRDGGSGSLRQTLARSRAGDTIILRTNGFLVLKSELVLDKNITLRGVPAWRTFLTSEVNSRILRVVEGVTATLDGLVLQEGSAVAMGAGAGGAILNEGTLLVRNCDLFANTKGLAVVN